MTTTVLFAARQRGVEDGAVTPPKLVLQKNVLAVLVLGGVLGLCVPKVKAGISGLAPANPVPQQP